STPNAFCFISTLFLECAWMSDTLGYPHVSTGGINGSSCRSRGFCRRCMVFPRRQRQHSNATASAPERTRPIRLLCAGPVLVAVVLRGGRRAWNAPAAAMRGAALLVRGAWVMAAIRERLPGILPAAGAAAQPQHRLLHARSDAGAAPDLQRMG